jgi:hypothetical protein
MLDDGARARGQQTVVFDVAQVLRRSLIGPSEPVGVAPADA